MPTFLATEKNRHLPGGACGRNLARPADVADVRSLSLRLNVMPKSVAMSEAIDSCPRVDRRPDRTRRRAPSKRMRTDRSPLSDHPPRAMPRPLINLSAAVRTKRPGALCGRAEVRNEQSQGATRLAGEAGLVWTGEWSYANGDLTAWRARDVGVESLQRARAAGAGEGRRWCLTSLRQPGSDRRWSPRPARSPSTSARMATRGTRLPSGVPDRQMARPDGEV